MKRNFWILFVIAVWPLLVLVSKPSLSQDVTSDAVPQGEAFKSKILDMPYEKARKIILNSGWVSVKNAAPDELMFVTRDMYDKGYVEVDLCSPVGDTPCNFYFKNGDEGYLRVITKEEVPHVVSVMILDEKAFRDARP